MRIFIFFSFISLLVFSSCQKEVSIDLRGNGPGGTANDTTVLSKFVVLDTTLPPGLDTLEVYLFKYDNQGRLEKVKSYHRSINLSSPAYDFTGEMTLYYNGSETQPFRTVGIADDGTSLDTQTGYYFYQQGFVTHDSIYITSTMPGFQDFGWVRYYSQTGNTISVNEKDFEYVMPGQPPTICETNSVYMQTLSNGNITNESITASGPCAGGGPGDLQVTYDTKVNPFYAIDIHYKVMYQNDGFFNAQKNNLLEQSSTSLNEHVKNFYTYRSDGYPLVVRSQDLIDPANSYKGLYFYIN